MNVERSLRTLEDVHTRSVHCVQMNEVRKRFWWNMELQQGSAVSLHLIFVRGPRPSHSPLNAMIYF